MIDRLESPPVETIVLLALRGKPFQLVTEAFSAWTDSCLRTEAEDKLVERILDTNPSRELKACYSIRRPKINITTQVIATAENGKRKGDSRITASKRLQWGFEEQREIIKHIYLTIRQGQRNRPIKAGINWKFRLLNFISVSFEFDGRPILKLKTIPYELPARTRGIAQKRIGTELTKQIRGWIGSVVSTLTD